MPIRPEQIDSTTLPTAMRGYERESTDELLKRIAWDYHGLTQSEAAATAEAKKLQRRVAELEDAVAGMRQTADRQGAAQRAELEREFQDRRAALEDEVLRLRRELSEKEARDELGRTLLANAQRSARELREATRAECDAVLKAARRRAVEIEKGAHASVRSASHEIERLHRLEADLREQLRRTLEAVLQPANREAEPEEERERPPVGVA